MGGGQRQAAHQFAKARFAAYKFQLFGSPLLTHAFIELPLCSAEQPANIIGQLVIEWDALKETPKYKNAVAASAKRQEGSQRLSSQIFAAQRDYNLGRVLAFQARRGALKLLDGDVVLDAEKLKLVENYESRVSFQKLNELVKNAQRHIAA